ncbi:hypothetical protein U8C32_02585 [Sinorhizobium medicae]|uniref:hypothetical protein n=1 Tax=Sinorhizobium TaxID=28105 RepID=UPI00035D076D|nr:MULTISPECIES: hypothetical protein [Sinorhizobium]RVN58488.1 hypothetical protein CN108_05475 [Sinorhizobium meliloti]WQO92530.1 hypothetical protein U8C32_02585 [Sinorhizobium medicae]
MDIIRDWWAQILTGVAILAWALRIEHQTKANWIEIDRIWKQRAEDLAAHRAAREETNEMLAEVRADIKELLRQVKS